MVIGRAIGRGYPARRTQQRDPDEIEADIDASTSGTGTEERMPIGVPPGYEARPPSPWEDWAAQLDPWERFQSQVTVPRYYEGDEFLPATWSPSRIEDLQRQMVNLGLIPPGATIRWGAFDQITLEAYAELLAFSNRSGVSWEKALTTMPVAELLEETGPGQEGPEYPPLTKRITDAETLRQVFREATISLTGEGFDRERIDNMVRAYQAQEGEFQEQLYEMQYNIGGEEGGESIDDWWASATGQESTPVTELSPQGEPTEDYYGPGGTIEELISPEAFARQQIEAEDPLAIPEHEMLGFAQEAIQLLGSPAWGTGIGGG